MAASILLSILSNILPDILSNFFPSFFKAILSRTLSTFLLAVLKHSRMTSSKHVEQTVNRRPGSHPKDTQNKGHHLSLDIVPET